MPQTAPQTDRLTDLGWLIDELAQLSLVRDVVPFDEKPGPLPSVTDMLRDWYDECREFCTPALFKSATLLGTAPLLDDVLSQSIALRKEWIQRLSAPDFEWERIVYEEEGRTLTASELCQSVIRQERALFKEIAERFHTIQKPVP
jgi:hypothetical protein